MIIPVASMTLQLIDADDFTREFYKSKMMRLGPAIVREQPTYPTIVETIPPYNGFGSEEDSLQTCKHKLILSAPTKDGAKLKALANMIMRYEAVMAEPGVRQHTILRRPVPLSLLFLTMLCYRSSIYLSIYLPTYRSSIYLP